MGAPRFRAWGGHPRLRFAYREAGPEEVRTVLLAHGKVSPNGSWRRVMESLASRWHLLVPTGVADWADDLAALVVAFHLEPGRHWVGWSLGSGVVMPMVLPSEGADKDRRAKPQAYGYRDRSASSLRARM